MNRYLRAAGRPALAVGTGAALIPAFQPHDLWFLAVPVVGAFALLVRGQSIRQAALLGLLTGLGFFVPFLPWIGDEVGPIPWLLLATLQALFFVPLGVVIMLVQRLPFWPAWVGAAWVADEALRGRMPYGGFTWGKLAFAQVDGPILGLAALGGSVLVSFAVAFAGALLAWAAVPTATDAAAAAAGGATAAVGSVPGIQRPALRRMAGTSPWERAAAVAGSAGVVLVGLAVPAPSMTGQTATVAVVQGNTPGSGLEFNARRQVIVDNHVRVTHELAADVAAGRIPQPNLVIWPENSSDVNPFADANVHASIDGAVEAIGVPALIGAVIPTADEQNVENTSIVWDPQTGPGATYVKQHPMPFGEYIPFRRIAEMIAPDAVATQPRDFVAGTEVGVLEMAAAPPAVAAAASVVVGPIICFEVAFDDLPRNAVRAGAQLLAVQTNNAGFGYSPMTEQQLAMSRLRAVEHGRWTLVAALAGVSAIIDPDGTVLERTELFTEGTMLADVQLGDDLTIATTVGGWPELLLTLAALVAAAVGWRAGRRGSPDGSDGETTTHPLYADVS